MNGLHFFLAGLPPVVTVTILMGCTNSFSAQPSEPVLTNGVVPTENGISLSGTPISQQSEAVTIDGDPDSVKSIQDSKRPTIDYRDGVIQSIRYDGDVKGPIDMMVLDGSLRVLGQTLHLFPGTVVVNSFPDAITSRDVIEVSGLHDSDGVLAASRIELKQSNTKPLFVQSYVCDFNCTLQMYGIGNLTKDYKKARIDDMNVSTLIDGLHVNGLRVEIKDESPGYEPWSLYLQAMNIENHDPAVHYPPTLSTDAGMSGDYLNSLSLVDSSPNELDLTGHTEVEIDGIVTGFDTAAGTLNVEGIEILTSHETEYQDDNERYVTQEAFFSKLRQGVSVVKVIWRPLTGYDQPPRKLELES